MMLIGFTSEDRLPNEVELIESALESGLDLLHLRKPSWSEGEMSSLISAISPQYYNRLTLHDHFSLTLIYPIGGVHLNSRSPLAPNGYGGRISRSCHSFDELALNCEMTYCTLSPIFDSISKSGYASKFTQKELKKGQKRAIIGQKTVALGGICAKNIAKIANFGFGGAAILGYLWEEPTVEGVIKRVESLRKEIDNRV